jgi:hypothetical protein
VRVQLLGDMSGTRNGQQWPPRGSTVDLPDDEALPLVQTRMARPVVDAPEQSVAVVLPVEDVRVVDRAAGGRPHGRGHLEAAAGVTAPVLLAGVRDWVCPNCATTDRTDARVGNRFHACAGLKGITAPLVAAGVRVKVEAREREDYVGRDMVQTDGDGRPVMSVVTTRDDGEDVAVLAPCATGSLRAGR